MGFRTSMSCVVTMVTIVCAICAALAGTMPRCQGRPHTAPSSAI